jgi:hypothetical protein
MASNREKAKQKKKKTLKAKRNTEFSAREKLERAKDKAFAKEYRKIKDPKIRVAFERNYERRKLEPNNIDQHRQLKPQGRPPRFGTYRETLKYMQGARYWYEHHYFIVRNFGDEARKDAFRYLTRLRYRAPSTAFRGIGRQQNEESGRFTGSNKGPLDVIEAWLKNLKDIPLLYSEGPAFDPDGKHTIEILVFRRVRPPTGYEEFIALVEADGR